MTAMDEAVAAMDLRAEMAAAGPDAPPEAEEPGEVAGLRRLLDHGGK